MQAKFLLEKQHAEREKERVSVCILDVARDTKVSRGSLERVEGRIECRRIRPEGASGR